MYKKARPHEKPFSIDVTSTAHYLGLYLYEQTYQERIGQSILEDKLSRFIKT
jgi:hypothetical protein